MGRKIVIIDPIPEGDWRLESSGDVLIHSGRVIGSLRIADADRMIKRWVRDPDTGQAVIDDVSVAEFLRIGYDVPEEGTDGQS